MSCVHPVNCWPVGGVAVTETTVPAAYEPITPMYTLTVTNGTGGGPRGTLLSAPRIRQVAALVRACRDNTTTRQWRGLLAVAAVGARQSVHELARAHAARPPGGFQLGRELAGPWDQRGQLLSEVDRTGNGPSIGKLRLQSMSSRQW